MDDTPKHDAGMPFPLLFYLFITLTTTHVGRHVSKPSHMWTPQQTRHADVVNVGVWCLWARDSSAQDI